MSERQIVYQRGDTLFVLPDPGQFDDPEIQVAVSLRNQANLAQRCPVCGARGLNREQRRRIKREQRGQVGIAAMVHEDGCPVSDPEMLALFARKGVVL